MKIILIILITNIFTVLVFRKLEQRKREMMYSFHVGKALLKKRIEDNG
jgi:hypothetical protein